MFINNVFEPVINFHSNMPFPIAITNENLLVTWANSSAMDLYPCLTLPDGLITMFVGAKFDMTIETLRLNEQISISSDPITPKYTSLQFTPMLENGQLIGTIVNFIVSPQKSNAYSQNSAQNIIDSITTEFRDPISIIFSAASVIANKIPDEQKDELNNYIESISHNCYKLLRTVSHVTEGSYFVSANNHFKMRNGDLSEFLFGICKAASLLTKDIGINLTYSIPGTPVMASFDAEKLTVAILNLISNSCKFTRDDNQIFIKLDTQGDTASITVFDKGIGIPDSVLGHIFEANYSFDPDGKPFSGVGLGLTLVKYIVCGHGGTVAVHSQELEGTTVSISIPLGISNNGADYISQGSSSYLRNRYSSLYIELADVCKTPTF